MINIKNLFSRVGMGSYLLAALVAFFAWAGLFHIDQIVRAQGQIIPIERTQIIQAADGGVLVELRVKEGELVHKGQVLALLESERAHAGVDEGANRIAGLQITRIRAQAEASGISPNWGRYRHTHPDLFQAQRALYEQNTIALANAVDSLKDNLRLSTEELQLTERLYTAGDISRIEYMRAERMTIDARQKLDDIQQKFRIDARKELAKIEEEITSQNSKLQERQSILDHTELQAPTDGIIKSLRINTLGGVLRPGDELMQISPTEGQYIVEAKVSPADVGQLHLGQKVSLKLDAFDYSIYGSLKGKLDYLSPDTLNEQGPDGKPMTFYRAQVLIEPNQDGTRIHLDQIKAGMTVSVDILTDQRSVLTYIAKPITRAFSGALGQR
jgi:adhesin transport system membrane fusion protein